MALRRYIAAAGEQAEIVAALDIAALWDRYLSEFLGEWDRLQRQQLPAQDLERQINSFLEELSEKPLDDLARRASGVAYNQGRSAATLGAAEDGEVEFVVRSEVMDEATCATCQIFDGAVFDVGEPDYYEYMPPAKCEGGDRCRGFYVPIRKGDIDE